MRNVDYLDLTQYGVEDTEAEPLEQQTDELVEVPPVNLHLTEEQHEYLEATIDPLQEDGNYGIHIYLGLLHIISGWEN